MHPSRTNAGLKISASARPIYSQAHHASGSALANLAWPYVMKNPDSQTLASIKGNPFYCECEFVVMSSLSSVKM
jgi:hypothetical protein